MSEHVEITYKEKPIGATVKAENGEVTYRVPYRAKYMRRNLKTGNIVFLIPERKRVEDE